MVSSIPLTKLSSGWHGLGSSHTSQEKAESFACLVTGPSVVTGAIIRIVSMHYILLFCKCMSKQQLLHVQNS